MTDKFFTEEERRARETMLGIQQRMAEAHRRSVIAAATVKVDKMLPDILQEIHKKYVSTAAERRIHRELTWIKKEDRWASSVYAEKLEELITAETDLECEARHDPGGRWGESPYPSVTLIVKF